MGKQLFKYLGHILLFVFLTLLSQVGGLIYLLCLPIFKYFKPRIARPIWHISLNIGIFCVLYTFTTFIIVPPLAERFGRVPMPYDEENPNLRQWNRWTVLLNRHYVVPELRAVTEGVARKMAAADTNLVITYLDCNFPFWDGFPLEPHLSHNDGRKIDLSFFYRDAETNKVTAERPSWLGYGVCEEPRGGEENRAEYCAQQGGWQYSFMRDNVISQSQKRRLPFDEKYTAALVRFFLADNRTKLVLIEPHLEKRLGFANQAKVKPPPCHSVRHDDHIHVAIY
ncbi:MAG: hypothetical protein JNL70_06515 [Saprospiraceae bacterium]|nr:hypothetical protein [Saprospiraceae bacterium]